jgi:excisionase family DNA binding protein
MHVAWIRGAKQGLLIMLPTGFLTVTQAAVALNVSEKTVRRRLDDGSLPGRQLGGKGKKWLVPVTAVNALPSDPPLPITEASPPVIEPVADHQRKRGPAPQWQRQLAALRNIQN